MAKIRKTKVIAEPGKQEIIITREFDASRKLVFKAFVDPALFTRWIGPRRMTTTLEKFEQRNGGSFRYVQKDRDGSEYAFHGVTHEVLEPSLIIQTWEFEGLPEKGHVLLQSAKFEEMPGGKTGFTGKSVFLSVEDRDGMMQSDMEEGVNESYERLDELLEEMKRR